MDIVLVIYGHCFGYTCTLFWLYMDIVLVIPVHCFGYTWTLFWLYMDIVLIIYGHCFGYTLYMDIVYDFFSCCKKQIYCKFVSGNWAGKCLRCFVS